MGQLHGNALRAAAFRALRPRPEGNYAAAVKAAMKGNWYPTAEEFRLAPLQKFTCAQNSLFGHLLGINSK